VAPHYYRSKNVPRSSFTTTERINNVDISFNIITALTNYLTKRLVNIMEDLTGLLEKLVFRISMLLKNFEIFTGRAGVGAYIFGKP
jgi:hypothetical protein